MSSIFEIDSPKSGTRSPAKISPSLARPELSLPWVMSIATSPSNPSVINRVFASLYTNAFLSTFTSILASYFGLSAGVGLGSPLCNAAAAASARAASSFETGEYNLST